MKKTPSFILWFLLLGAVVSVNGFPMERSTPLLGEEGRQRESSFSLMRDREEEYRSNYLESLMEEQREEVRNTAPITATSARGASSLGYPLEEEVLTPVKHIDEEIISCHDSVPLGTHPIMNSISEAPISISGFPSALATSEESKRLPNRSNSSGILIEEVLTENITHPLKTRPDFTLSQGDEEVHFTVALQEVTPSEVFFADDEAITDPTISALSRKIQEDSTFITTAFETTEKAVDAIPRDKRGLFLTKRIALWKKLYLEETRPRLCSSLETIQSIPPENLSLATLSSLGKTAAFNAHVAVNSLPLETFANMKAMKHIILKEVESTGLSQEAISAKYDAIGEMAGAAQAVINDTKNAVSVLTTKDSMTNALISNISTRILHQATGEIPTSTSALLKNTLVSFSNSKKARNSMKSFLEAHPDPLSLKQAAINNVIEACDYALTIGDCIISLKEDWQLPKESSEATNTPETETSNMSDHSIR